MKSERERERIQLALPIQESECTLRCPTRYYLYRYTDYVMIIKRLPLFHSWCRRFPERLFSSPSFVCSVGLMLANLGRRSCLSIAARRDANKSSVKFPWRSSDRFGDRSIDDRSIRASSFPEVIKRPMKITVCRRKMARSNSKSTLRAGIIRIAFAWYKVAIFGRFFLTRGFVKPVFTLIIIVSASNNECNSPGRQQELSSKW